MKKIENDGTNRHSLTLGRAVQMWPTPRANDAEKRGNLNAFDPRNGLPAAVMIWPTPTATAYKGSSPVSLTRKDGRSRERDRLDHAVMASDGGQLNPDWVEWLMGFPSEWTALNASATPSSRKSHKPSDKPSRKRRGD